MPVEQWVGVAAATIAKYFRTEQDAVMRRRKFYAMLNDRGLISTSQSGTHMEWPVRFNENRLAGFDESLGLQFPRFNRHKRAVLDWRGYEMAESITDKEKEMNKGAEALVKLFSNKARFMMEDAKASLGEEMYIDGNASGNEQRWHGLESFLSSSGTASGAPVGNNNDTYADILTTRGSYGGSWSDANAWPEGSGTAAYDFWSPIIVDYTSAQWPQSTKTWPNTCLDALRFGLHHARRNDNPDEQIDVVFLARDLYIDFLNRLQLEENINITPAQGSSGLYKLGFTDVQNFDGVDITSEFNTTAARGYGLAMNCIELQSLKPQVLNAQGPYFDEDTQSYKFALVAYANLMFRKIRGFVAWKALT